MLHYHILYSDYISYRILEMNLTTEITTTTTTLGPLGLYQCLLRPPLVCQFVNKAINLNSMKCIFQDMPIRLLDGMIPFIINKNIEK